MTTNVQGRSQILRAAIVSALAAAALSQMPVREAQADCSDTVSGVITCDGNLAGGVNVSQPGDPNDFNDLGTTVLRIENVIGEIAPGLLTNGVRIDERRPARAGGGGQMQNVTIHLTGTEADPLSIRTNFASGVTATTLAGEANDGADATSGFLCAGSDSADPGQPGLHGQPAHGQRQPTSTSLQRTAPG